ncbi:MAG: hypothetical protein ACPGQD_06880 [Planctomycetota bacterium]
MSSRARSLLLVLIAACSPMSTAPDPGAADISRPVTVDLDAVQRLLWAGEDDLALALLETQRWEWSGSVAAERRWQNLIRRAGREDLVAAELLRLRETHPGLNPDLDYLQARMLEDGPTRARRFEQLHRRWPDHPWIRLGHAATSQVMGRWRRADSLLEAPVEGDEVEAFRRALLARQAFQAGSERGAFSLLEDGAFAQGQELALYSYLDLAERVGDGRHYRRAAAEIALREAAQADSLDAARIDLAMERYYAEQPWLRQRDLQERLVLLDEYSRRAGAPSGWSEQPRYEMAGFATLVQPEAVSGDVASRWLAAGRFLLAGEAIGRGAEIHLLTDTTSFRLAWPGEEQEVTVVLARGRAEERQRIAQGGTVFRGFYLRLDSLADGVRALERRLQGRRSPTADATRLPAGLADPDDLESRGLPDRLRLLVLEESGTSIAAQEIWHLAVHEAGHLGEILPWLNEGLPLLEFLPRFLGSQADFDDPLLWLEERAELRALAASADPRWAIAEVVERAQDPRAPYHGPYRRILRDLLRQARAAEGPALADWDLVDPVTLAGWIEAVLEEEGIDPIPAAGLDPLRQRLEELQLLDPAAGDRLPSD